ncbi:hypothetical protein NDU88_006298 [Pleurodeles waltl]|uniref:Uncharacterized protein n=1 Tax=Pleurodeles waltl TaxID=8319 RepID=A0AAV7RL71_PLEWA|nr:hypothetical protein NDU88_006298 [Pleurodeles waltl]
MGGRTPSMLELKTLIMEGNKAITEKIDGVATKVALMQQDMDKLRDKVQDMGTRMDGRGLDEWDVVEMQLQEEQDEDMETGKPYRGETKDLNEEGQ